MTRLTSCAALVFVLGGAIAHAETQAEIAARLNEEGKELMFANNFKDASAKFQDAVARVPEAKYFFNLCTSRYQEGKFGEALTACNSVEKNNPDDKLRGKTAKLTDKIREEAKTQGIDLQPTGGGGGETNVDPNVTPTTNPDPNQPPDPNANPNQPQPRPGPTAVGRPPSQGLFTAVAPSHDYTWSLGVDLYGGGGKIGQPNYYGTAAGGIRFKGDYMLNAASRIGLQGYLQITNFGKGTMDSAGVGALDVFDIGVAAYKHFCPIGGRFCLTPLGGLHLSLMDPNQDQMSSGQVFNYTAVGARVELNASYAFGARYEYVLQAFLGANLYSAVLASPTDGPTAAQLGLDQGGAAGYLGLGFTYRFNTPFGRAPFVTLE